MNFSTDSFGHTGFALWGTHFLVRVQWKIAKRQIAKVNNRRFDLTQLELTNTKLSPGRPL